jgi:hypothetical protein
VSFVRVPVPRFTPHALIGVRRWCLPPRRAVRRYPRPRVRPSATDRSLVSPALLRRKPRRESCLLAFDRVGSPEFPARRRSPAGFQSPVHRHRVVHTRSPSDLDRAVQIASDPGSNRSIPVNPQSSTRRRFQPPDRDPADQIRPPRLDLVFLQENPRVSLDLQPGPSTLRFSRG